VYELKLKRKANITQSIYDITSGIGHLKEPNQQTPDKDNLF